MASLVRLIIVSKFHSYRSIALVSISKHYQPPAVTFNKIGNGAIYRLFTICTVLFNLKRH